MTLPASIANHIADDPATVAQQCFDTARRRRAEAAAEARLAHERLLAAEEQERHARRALRDAGTSAPSGAAEMIGMGYFPDEVMVAVAS
jgi:hypothetical protein